MARAWPAVTEGKSPRIPRKSGPHHQGAGNLFGGRCVFPEKETLNTIHWDHVSQPEVRRIPQSIIYLGDRPLKSWGVGCGSKFVRNHIFFLETPEVHFWIMSRKRAQDCIEDGPACTCVETSLPLDVCRNMPTFTTTHGSFKRFPRYLVYEIAGDLCSNIMNIKLPFPCIPLLQYSQWFFLILGTGLWMIGYTDGSGPITLSTNTDSNNPAWQIKSAYTYCCGYQSE